MLCVRHYLTSIRLWSRSAAKYKPSGLVRLNLDPQLPHIANANLQTRNDSSQSYPARSTQLEVNVKAKAHGLLPKSVTKIPAASKLKESQEALMRLKKLSVTERRDLFERLRAAGKADVYHYSTMIGLSASSSEAEKIFSIMKNDGIKPNIVTYNTVLRKMMNEGRLSSAEKIFKELVAKFAPDQFTFCILINGFSKFGKHARAEKLYTQLKSQIKTLDSASYHTAISMFCRSGKHDEAEKVIAEMRIFGIIPSASAYTILISSYGKVGRPEDSLRIFSELKQSGVEIDTTLQNSLMHSLAVNGKISEAENIARGHKSLSADENVKGQQIREVECESKSNIELLALHLSRSVGAQKREVPSPGRMYGDQGVTSSDSQLVDVATVTALINAYGRCRRVEDAQELFKCLGHLKIRPGVEAYNALISTCAHNGDLDLAEHYYVEMLEGGLAPDTHTMRALIDGSEASGDSLAAMDWLSEAARRSVPPFSNFAQWEEGSGGKRVLAIDLHCMSALSSTVAVRYILTSRRLDPRETELVIITGKGRHSEAGPVVGPAVARFLAHEGFRYSYAHGNAGRLVLHAAPGGAATVALCAVLVALMWAGGMLVAAAWAENFRRRTAEANRLLALAQMRAELRRGLAQHARQNRERRERQ